MMQFLNATSFVVVVALLLGLTACDDTTTDPNDTQPGTFEAQAEVDGETFSFSANAFFADGADVDGEDAGMAVLFTTQESCVVEDDEPPAPPYAALAREATRPDTGTYTLASFDDEELGENFAFFWLEADAGILSESGTVTVTTSSSDTFAGTIEGEVLMMGAGMEEPASGDLSVEFEATSCPELLIPSADGMTQ